MQSAIEHARSRCIAFSRDADESLVLVHESVGRLVRRMGDGNSAQPNGHYHVIAESHLNVLDCGKTIRRDGNQATLPWRNISDDRLR